MFPSFLLLLLDDGSLNDMSARLCIFYVCIDSLVPVRFNPDTYFVTEGLDTNANITLEALVDHTFDFTVTVVARDGSAAREYKWMSHKLQYDRCYCYCTYTVQLCTIE